MKNILFACFFFSAAFVAAQDYDVSDPAPAFKIFKKDKDVTLNAGTLILLETNEKMESDAVTVGQTVQFRVRTNVLVNGKVAICSGALATGRVKAIQSATRNDAEEIRVELLYVQAVDGQMLPLNGNEQTIRGAYAGQGTTVQTGTAITAHVTNTVEVKVK